MNIKYQIRFCLILPILALLFICSLFSCSAYKRIEEPISPTFLEGADVKSSIKNLPFDQAWVKNDFDGRNFKKLLIKPVRVDLVDYTQWEKSASVALTSKEDYTKEVQEVANFFSSEIKSKISNFKDNRIEFVEAVAPDVLTLELAITEMQFSHPIATAGALASPIPGTGAVVASIAEPFAAFAARISLPDGTLVATAADRKFPPTRLVDLNELTIASPIREICSNWAVEIAEGLNKGRFAPTEQRGTISILPF